MRTAIRTAISFAVGCVTFIGWLRLFMLFYLVIVIPISEAQEVRDWPLFAMGHCER
jgi:hypothetical protein